GLADLAPDLDGDLLRQVALLDPGRDLSYVADLARQVAGHDVDVVGEVLPDAAHADNLGLTPQPAFGADLAGHARHLVGERVELVDHCVDRLLELEDLAPDVDGDLFREVTLLDRGGDLSDVADLARQVAGHEVHVVGEVLPDTADPLDLALAANPPPRALHPRASPSLTRPPL